MENQTPVVYGIANCDSVKKARAWLVAHGIQHDFVDFKKDPPTHALLTVWMAQLGWEKMLNRRGTSWRKLSLSQQALLVDAASASRLMQRLPSVIRRPIIQWPAGSSESPGWRITIGFEPKQWPLTG